MSGTTLLNSILQDALIPVLWARTKVHNDKKNGPLKDLTAVRFYPYSPGVACLQIRTEGQTTDHGRTSHQAFSSAGLGLLEAMQLRNELSHWISEWGQEQQDEAYKKMYEIEMTSRQNGEGELIEEVSKK